MRTEDAMTAEVVELLRTLIRNACVNDGTDASGHEIRSADTLEAYLSGVGLAMERYTAAPGRVSLVTRIDGRDRRAPTLLLLGHTDVVPADGRGWRHDPFAADVDDGVVWGRGAIDMLNLTATMAVACRRLAADGFRPAGTLIVAAVADEEANGAHGVAHLLDHHADAIRADYVITEAGGVPVPSREGPLLPVAVGEKGVGWRRLVVRGTAGHGALPFGADNALVTAAAVVQRLASYQSPARILDVWRRTVEALGLDPAITAALTDPERVLDAARWLDSPGLARVVHACTHTTLSPNVVRGGTNVNVIPDRVVIEVDVRTLPGVKAADVDAMLADALGDLAERVEISAPAFGEGSISPMETPLRDALARVAAALVPGSRLVPQLTPGATDARHFRWRGVPAYGFGLHSPRIPYTEYPLMFHGDNERIDVESLGLSCLLWERLARDFLG